MRKLASVQAILEVNEHPNADRLELIKVLGWQCVSKKGTFKPGDLAVYFEIDSLIPIKEWSAFLEDKNKPGQPVRLKTMRLRKELSQGLLIPLEAFDAEYSAFAKRDEIPFVAGDDVTGILGIEKYEPPIPTCLSGDSDGPRPGWIRKTDEDRIQAFPDLIEEFKGKLVYVTQKIDGTSGSFAIDIVSGRNWTYKPETENTYWEMAKKYDLLPKLKKIKEETGDEYYTQGEIAGPGIQKNRLGLKEHELFIFNVKKVSAGKPCGYNEIVDFCNHLELQMVPVLYFGTFKWTSIEELLEEARGKYPSGKHQEGIVIRPVEPFYSNVLNGPASFKVINNEFLESGGD
jgi:RNA ligase (TIGR02306 family)